MMPEFICLDVRPILRAGGEPFDQIMNAVAALRPGEGLRLLATFKPVPLFSILGAKGFTHDEQELDDGDWEVLFRASAAVGSPDAPTPAPPPTGAECPQP